MTTDVYKLNVGTWKYKEFFQYLSQKVPFPEF